SSSARAVRTSPTTSATAILRSIPNFVCHARRGTAVRGGPAFRRDTMIENILAGSATSLSYRARSVLESLGRPLIETACGSFDVQAFVRAGRATMREKDSIIQERLHGWHDGIYTHVETGWLEVDWDGDTFDVISIAWDSSGCRQARTFVLAPSIERAEALFTTVCQFCTGTVEREIL